MQIITSCCKSCLGDGIREEDNSDFFCSELIALCFQKFELLTVPNSKQPRQLRHSKRNDYVSCLYTPQDFSTEIKDDPVILNEGFLFSEELYFKYNIKKKNVLKHF